MIVEQAPSTSNKGSMPVTAHRCSIVPPGAAISSRDESCIDVRSGFPTWRPSAMSSVARDRSTGEQDGFGYHDHARHREIRESTGHGGMRYCRASCHAGEVLRCEPIDPDSTTASTRTARAVDRDRSQPGDPSGEHSPRKDKTPESGLPCSDHRKQTSGAADSAMRRSSAVATA